MVGTWEQCPLTLAATEFFCTHHTVNVLGTGENNFSIWPSVPIVPTLYPLKINMCGNSDPPYHTRLTGSLGTLVPAVPTTATLFFTHTHKVGVRRPRSLACCILLAGFTHLLVPLQLQPRRVRLASTPTQHHSCPVALPCTAIASCPCRSVDSSPLGRESLLVWDHAPW